MTSVRIISESNRDEWDIYVTNHPDGKLYHLSGWKNVIEKTYGHKTYYLLACSDIKKKIQTSGNSASTTPIISSMGHVQQALSHVTGILPLVHLKHFFFGNSLISISFFDFGGILADDEVSKEALLTEAIKLGKKLKAKNIELRHSEPFSLFARQQNIKKIIDTTHNCLVKTNTHKVRILLPLPESSEALWKSFKSKLRSQIKKAIKEGLHYKIGGLELVDDFYRVFLINMRDLGSPVHSKKIIMNALKEFSDKARIAIVYKDDLPLAGSIIIGFKQTLENPWASSLRQYSRLSPNMLLYWAMLEYACENNYCYFDFGRSSPDEGTYKFKIQWGAKSEPLYWYHINLKDLLKGKSSADKSKFDRLISYWKKLPVPVTKIIGPRIRKHIGL